METIPRFPQKTDVDKRPACGLYQPPSRPWQGMRHGSAWGLRKPRRHLILPDPSSPIADPECDTAWAVPREPGFLESMLPSIV